MIGKEIAHYRILAEIGRGSMGVVFKALDTQSGQLVALKILIQKLVDDPDKLHRFEREGRAASALHHPNICTVFASGSWQGRPYLAMELLHGQTLAERLASGVIPGTSLFATAIGATRALEATHAIGVVHRDIKPANLFLTVDGQLKMLDFGLAKEKLPPAPVNSEDASTAFTTRPGMMLGTLAYMSPEQVRCEPLDGRSDLYSLGATLYELAIGQLMVRGAAHFNALPAGMGPIVAKLTAMEPAQRYQSAREAREAFERCAGQAPERALGQAAPR